MLPIWFVWLHACAPLSNDPLLPGPCHGGEGLFYPLQEGAWWRHDQYTRVGLNEYDLCKLVEVPPIDTAPFHGSAAWPVLSLSVERGATTGTLARRWQEEVNGSIHRLVDEVFTGPTLSDPLKYVKIYCPFAGRVYDCPGACDGAETDVKVCAYGCQDASWEENLAELTLTVEDPTSPDQWSTCLGLAIDPLTCTVPVDAPSFCLTEREDVRNLWTVEAVHESISFDGHTWDTMREAHKEWDPLTGDWGAKDYFNWARGLGKIREVQSTTEREHLVEACVPTTRTTPATPMRRASRISSTPAAPPLAGDTFRRSRVAGLEAN